jgi:hypothetical protein
MEYGLRAYHHTARGRFSDKAQHPSSDLDSGAVLQ